MPPSTNPPPSQPDAVPVRMPPDIAAVATFFSLEGYGAGLASTGFTRMEAVSHVVGIARNADKDGDRLNALNTLHRWGLDLMDANGVTARMKETRTTDSQGNTNVIQEVARSNILGQLLAHRPHEPAALEGVIVIGPTSAPAGPPLGGDAVRDAAPPTV